MREGLLWPSSRCGPACIKSLIDMSPCPDSEDGDQKPDQRDVKEIFRVQAQPLKARL